MKNIFYDYFPVIAFFVVYKLWGIYAATATIMGTGLLQLLLDRIIYKKIELKHLITTIILVVFGTLTLIFHDPMFIKWKVTAVYWALALAFLFTQWFTKKPLIQTLLTGSFEVPRAVWRRLNFSWAIFFLAMSFANLYVMYHYDTNTWVNFKLFGTLSATLVFAFVQGIFIHIAQEKVNRE